MFIPQKFEDPMFGQMKLIDDETSYHGRVFFAPLNQQIEINVLSKSCGPTKDQHTLFRQIEDRYFDWIENLPPCIEKNYPFRKGPLTVLDFTKNFELIAIRIPEYDDNKKSWGVEYTTDGLDGWIEIQFINWMPSNFSFEQ